VEELSGVELARRLGALFTTASRKRGWLTFQRCINQTPEHTRYAACSNKVFSPAGCVQHGLRRGAQWRSLIDAFIGSGRCESSCRRSLPCGGIVISEQSDWHLTSIATFRRLMMPCSPPAQGWAGPMEANAIGYAGKRGRSAA